MGAEYCYGDYHHGDSFTCLKCGKVCTACAGFISHIKFCKRKARDGIFMATVQGSAIQEGVDAENDAVWALDTGRMDSDGMDADGMGVDGMGADRMDTDGWSPTVKTPMGWISMIEMRTGGFSIRVFTF